MTGRIVILTGPPGSGKTTLAPRLAERSAYEQAAHVHADNFYSAIRKGWVAPWLPESHGQNLIVVDAIAATATIYARGGYDLILDGIVGNWVREAIRAAAGDLPVHYVVLRPAEAVAARRAAGRELDRLEDYAPFRKLYEEFAAVPHPHCVDNAELSVDATADIVLTGLANGRFRLG